MYILSLIRSCEISLSLSVTFILIMGIYMFQGRIQDFEIEGAQKTSQAQSSESLYFGQGPYGRLSYLFRHWKL